MYKPNRIELIDKIVRLANLPPGKKTLNYLTRVQLIELSLYLENVKFQLKSYFSQTGSRGKDAKNTN